jgi:hypothetical protein
MATDYSRRLGHTQIHYSLTEACRQVLMQPRDFVLLQLQLHFNFAAGLKCYCKVRGQG